MKLNDFLDKRPVTRSSAKKVITVANEKKEAELVAQINILQHEVDRLHVVDSERNNFNQRMQAAEIQLKEVLEREVELKTENGLLKDEVNQGDSLRETNQTLRGELKDVNGQLGIQEAVLEQSEKNSLELNKTAEDLTKQVKGLQEEEENVEGNKPNIISDIEEKEEYTPQPIKYEKGSL